MKNREPWSFCETPEEKCTMNYCDENGCQNRKRILVNPELEGEYISNDNIKEGRLWIPTAERLPQDEGYYAVKFENGVEDEKPFRIRLNKNIYGFMTLENVTHWAHLND